VVFTSSQLVSFKVCFGLLAIKSTYKGLILNLISTALLPVPTKIAITAIYLYMLQSLELPD